jgi:2-polyprenyl-3-methyl-5-hydroxy-6-metoxy-1,4-benzoquinol methylase
MGKIEHWEAVYRTKRPTEVSWYAAHLKQSLQLIRDASPDQAAKIIDVGGGESTLPDDLLALGYRNVTVLDLSATAIEVAKARLGRDAERITWLQGDVTSYPFPADEYDVWHDRAVFHFLTEPGDRAAYVRQVRHSVKVGGYVIVATFAEDGPTICSGLPVVRYAAKELHAQFGATFELQRHMKELHSTPAGKVQSFVYCYCRKG